MHTRFIKKLFSAWLDGLAHIRFDNGCENTVALISMLDYMNTVQAKDKSQKQHLKQHHSAVHNMTPQIKAPK